MLKSYYTICYSDSTLNNSNPILYILIKMTYEVVCAHFNWKYTLYFSVPFFPPVCVSIVPSFFSWHLTPNLEYTCKTIDSRSVVLKYS